MTWKKFPHYALCERNPPVTGGFRFHRFSELWVLAWTCSGASGRVTDDLKRPPVTRGALYKLCDCPCKDKTPAIFAVNYQDASELACCYYKLLITSGYNLQIHGNKWSGIGDFRCDPQHISQKARTTSREHRRKPPLGAIFSITLNQKTMKVSLGFMTTWKKSHTIYQRLS